MDAHKDNDCFGMLVVEVEARLEHGLESPFQEALLPELVLEQDIPWEMPPPFAFPATRRVELALESLQIEAVAAEAMHCKQEEVVVAGIG